jgi:hypothetical protein
MTDRELSAKRLEAAVLKVRMKRMTRGSAALIFAEVQYEELITRIAKENQRRDAEKAARPKLQP